MAEHGRDDTSFITFWTDGQANLFDAFPARGDAPGRDPAQLPRPPRSRRLLSAWEKDRGSSLSLYRSETMDAGALDGFYRRELMKNGWQVLDDRRPESMAAGGKSAFLAERRGRTVFFTIVSDANGKGHASVSEMN
jgi:hypothetical protein